jgi:hypothetical protein
MARRKRSRDEVKADALQGVLLTADWAAATCTLETVEKYLRQICEPGGGLPDAHHGKVARARFILRAVYVQLTAIEDTRPLGWPDAFDLARLDRTGEELQ